MVPTLLVFGVLLRLPVFPKDLPEQRDRMRAMQTARVEMSQIMSKTRVNVALSRNVPAAADADIRILDEGLIFREKPIKKRTGPYKVLNVDGKIIYAEVNGRLTQFSVDKVRLYLQADENGSESDDHEYDEDRHVFDDIQTQTHVDGPNEDDDEYGKLLDDYWNLDQDFVKKGNQHIHC